MSLADFEHVAYHKAFETDYALFELEELARGHGDGATMLLVHARLRRWSPCILKDCLKHWRLFRTVVTQDLFASPQASDEKSIATWRHFVSIFGFVPLLEGALCNDGVLRPIYIHRVGN